MSEKLIKKAAETVDWTVKELLEEAKRLEWIQEFLANHLLKEDRISKITKKIKKDKKKLISH